MFVNDASAELFCHMVELVIASVASQYDLCDRKSIYFLRQNDIRTPVHRRDMNLFFKKNLSSD